jgi:uncharacterized Zn finger protein
MKPIERDPRSCPRCGCDETAKVARRSGSLWPKDRGGGYVERRRCAECAHVFSAKIVQAGGDAETPAATRPKRRSAKEEAARDALARGVVYRVFVVRCPACDSDDVRITSTRGATRYHKCRACGGTFKSTEHREDGRNNGRDDEDGGGARGAHRVVG